MLYEELISDSERILSTYSKGRLAFSGTRVTILGKPNAGKSTLLNVLLEEDRAIVSTSPGTTRDILEADIIHNGRRIIFYDTAGLRSTKGKVEAEGVRRAKDKAEFSDVVIILVEKNAILEMTTHTDHIQGVGTFLLEGPPRQHVFSQTSLGRGLVYIFFFAFQFTCV